MRARVRFEVLVTMLVCLCAGGAHAQGPEPSAFPVVVLDVRGSYPSFPDDPELAASRGLTTAELPRRGPGADANIHIYVYRRKGFALGLGAQATGIQARKTQDALPGQKPLPPVTTRFGSLSAQLSFNFGSGD